MGDVKAVLFDMDGVLTDSVDTSVEAAQKMYKEMYEVDVEEKEFMPYSGMAEDDFVGGPAKDRGIDAFDMDKARDKYMNLLLEIVDRDASKIGMPGAARLVKSVKEKGLKMAVASSAHKVRVKANLKAAGIDLDSFDAVVCCDTFHGPLKPEPDVFLKAASDVGEDPSNCVVIEDSSNGITAAKKGGFRVIAVCTSESRSDVEGQEPTAIFESAEKFTADDIMKL